MRDNKLYISGFDDAQLVVIINFLNEFCLKNKIKSIIFDQKISKKISSLKEYNKLNEKFSIYNFEKVKKNAKLNLICFLIFNFFKILKFSFNLNRNILLNKSLSWYECQIYHSIWDTCYLNQSEEDLMPTYILKLYYSIVVFANIYYARLVINHKTKIALMGHLVYASKAKIAEFRKSKIKIIGHTAESYFKLDRNTDMMWMIIKKNHPNTLNKNLLRNYTKKYWNKRISGQGIGEDTRVASKSKGKFNKQKYKNVIMLHIFKDSPFNFIDRERIFCDYYEWVEKTLEILCKSKEKWVIRTHPNSKRWGENSEKIFTKILNKVIRKTGLKPNIIFDRKKISNLNIFKHSKRIVTFSGTPHIEAVCFGVKPIVISDVTLSVISKEMVYKPKNITSYENIILSNKNLSILRSKKKEIDLAKKILFITENTLSFQKQLNLKLIYRSDKKSKLISNFIKTKNKLDDPRIKMKLLESINYLNTSYKRSMNWKFINLIKKNYRYDK